jgi:hypothetical protein
MHGSMNVKHHVRFKLFSFIHLFFVISAVAVHSAPVYYIHRNAASVPCGTISQVL